MSNKAIKEYIFVGKQVWYKLTEINNAISSEVTKCDKRN